MSTASLFFVLLAVIQIALLVCYARAGRPLKCLFFTVFSGVGALGLVWIAGRLIAIPLAITPLSLAMSGVLGVPGVVFMLLLHIV